MRHTIAARIVSAVCVAAALACGRPAPGPSGGTGDVDALERVAVATDGMVVSGSEPATRAGAEILGRGGNAVDAAVATALALAVTEPTQSGLGGRTQALVRLASGEAFGVDATTAVPAGYDPDTAEQADDGYATIGVPGSVAGLARLLEQAGSLPWATVIEPAVRLAEEGFALSEGEAGRLAEVRERLLLSEGARGVFLRPDGTSFEAGEILRQPDLAGVLRTLRDEGPDAFYRGSIGATMAADLAARGYVAASDVSSYEPKAAIVVHGRFAALDLTGTYLPAAGATTIEALQILDRLALARRSPDEQAIAIGRALLAAFADRESVIEDARPPEGDAAWITSAALADLRAGGIDAAREGGVGAMADAGGAGAQADGAAAGAAGEHPESEHTTHISVVDRDGMAVALTQSLGPTGGSRVATPGLGFLYAATLGGYLGRVEPGDRPWSSQSPLIARRDGRTAFVMGGAGSRRIVSSIVQTIVRIEIGRRTPADAMAAPRFHPSGTWTFEQTSAPAASDSTSSDSTSSGSMPPGARLATELGYRVSVEPSSTFFARLNVIFLDPDGTMTGVADPRWAWGAASGPR